jgi:hypothetical protein
VGVAEGLLVAVFVGVGVEVDVRVAVGVSVFVGDEVAGKAVTVGV